MLFRDPLGESRIQIDKALALRPTALFAIDFLFWDVYGSTDPAWREDALRSGLAALDRVLEAGAWIVLGDVPHITTAAEWMLPRERIPDRAVVAAIDEQIAAWARSRPHVLLVPFAAWTTPLLANDEVELAPGERLPARSLLAPDGLHANPLGTWYLLDKLDRFIEARLPGTPPDALVFARPAL
jgi:phage tail protein X